MSDDRLYFTDSDDANELNYSDPMALLIAFVLEQQVTVQKAFMGPLVIKERVGSLEAKVLAETDLDPVFREKPAVHRFPGAMAERVSALAVMVRDEYGGDAAAVWTGASSPEDLKARLAALPGFGDMKIMGITSVLAKRMGVHVAEALVPNHPTLGDVDSAEAMASYQQAKREYKAKLKAAQAKA